jgi:hypothetical protein
MDQAGTHVRGVKIQSGHAAEMGPRVHYSGRRIRPGREDDVQQAYGLTSHARSCPTAPRLLPALFGHILQSVHVKKGPAS